MPDREEILKTIEAAFAHEPRLDVYRYPLHMALVGGVLTLEGEVEHIAAKKLCLDLAAAVPGVDGIVDQLRVAPAVPMSDETIRDHVRDVLYQEPAFATFALEVGDQEGLEPVRPSVQEPFGVIAVIVDDGVLTLDGQVPSLSHKRLAGVLTWWVPGSREVVNGLAVEPSQEDNDEEITDAIHLVLEKDPFVKADHIGVHTKERVVTLDGVVPNDSIKEMAEFDAWYVFGVDRVINQLAVQR
jgi:osmotically-inducible protein OsmY